ncbi:hypothetical protein D9M69_648530 [compost metagenome]
MSVGPENIRKPSRPVPTKLAESTSLGWKRSPSQPPKIDANTPKPKVLITRPVSDGV